MSATTNRYHVSIEADPTLPIIRLSRDFDATPAQSLVDSFEAGDQWLASGMETGVEEGYAKLGAQVAEL